MRLALLLFVVGLVGCTHDDDEAHQLGPDQSVDVDLSFPSIDFALKVDLASADLLPCPSTGVTESSACADVGEQCNYICAEGECICYPSGWLCFPTPCP